MDLDPLHAVDHSERADRVHQRRDRRVVDELFLHILVVLTDSVLIRVDARIVEPLIDLRVAVREAVRSRLLLRVEVEVENTVGVLEEDANDETGLLARASGITRSCPPFWRMPPAAEVQPAWSNNVPALL
jgi:hypothetical protein